MTKEIYNVKTKFHTRIIVAGVTGYIGEALVKELSKNNYRVICPSRNKSPIRFDNSNLIFEKVNLCDESFIDKLVKKHGSADVIISCIGSRTGRKKEA